MRIVTAVVIIAQAGGLAIGSYHGRALATDNNRLRAVLAATQGELAKAQGAKRAALEAYENLKMAPAKKPEAGPGHSAVPYGVAHSSADPSRYACYPR